MKTKYSAPSTSSGSHTTGKADFVPPAIPIKRPRRKAYKKDKVLSLKLWTSPAEANSQTYKLTVLFFCSDLP